MKTGLVMDKRRIKERKEAFKAAQNYIDKKALQFMMPYVPVGLPKYKNSGALRDSGKVSSSGVIVFTAKKARHDYYNRKVNHKHGGNPNALPLWFEYMKKKHGGAILRGVAALTGGKPSK